MWMASRNTYLSHRPFHSHHYHNTGRLEIYTIFCKKTVIVVPDNAKNL